MTLCINSRRLNELKTEHCIPSTWHGESKCSKQIVLKKKMKEFFGMEQTYHLLKISLCLGSTEHTVEKT